MVQSSVYSNDSRVCAFCDKEITTNGADEKSNRSICMNCSRKFNINTSDLGEEGCGCDG
jgi:hypothetical protein